MAKRTRSKSQPEFDPSELDDLIFTPAVGSGVGSHLAVKLTTVDSMESATVDSLQVAEKPTEQEIVTTVVDLNMPTVVTSNNTTVVNSATVDTTNQSTVDMIRAATANGSAQVSPVSSPLPFWVTEQGEFVAASRVRRIRFAQDVLNSAEEAVYDALWAVKGSNRSSGDTEASRVVQAGYDFLMKRTRLSKKTIQRIIDRLLDKDFITIEQPADIYHRTPTVYRVYSYRSVLERQGVRNRHHVVKIGPGFLYVHPLDNPANLNLSTVGSMHMATVDSLEMSTVDRRATATVDIANPTTVVPQSTNKERNDQLGNSTAEQAAVALLGERLAAEIGIFDKAAVAGLWRQCRARAGDCTIEEIAYFAIHKFRMARGVQNPAGFLLTVVPRQFERQGHLAVREMLRIEAAERSRERKEAYEYWTAEAQAPDATTERRAQAERALRELQASAGRSPQDVF